MPLASPRKKESKDDFISRFMSSKSAVKEFPEVDQRLAVAYDKWKESYKQNSDVFVNLTHNMSQLVRFDTLDGKDYLVAPVILIKEGVLNGSAGPILYEGSDIELSTESWNHKPLVVYHPTFNNRPLSAASKTIIEKQQVGILLDARYEDGKLKANAWIDIEKSNKIDPRVIAMIENNEMMEVSTGLFTDTVIYNGEWEGKEYEAIAKNYRPDHLALLPDKTGACSIKDGAGLPRLNSENKDNNKQGDVSMERQKQVEKLISNAANTWATEDSEFLIDLEQDKFDKIFSMNQEEIKDAPVEEPKEDVGSVEDKPVENQEEAPNEGPVVEEESKEEPVENQEEEPVANKEVTLESYIEDAPEGISEILKGWLDVANAKKDELVSKIKANAKCGYTEEQLKAKDTKELEIISNMLPEETTDYSAQAGPVSNQEEPAMPPISNYL